MATEKRLIDAERFKRILQNTDRRLKGFGQHKMSELIESIIKNLDLQPTVDAVEVVHGRWVNPYMNRYGHPCHCCSICGFKASYQDKNYCPNCGAKMDGDGNG